MTILLNMVIILLIIDILLTIEKPNDTNYRNTIRIIFNGVIRIIVLPFIVMIYTISSIRYILEYSIAWLLYGGELITYTKNTRKSIQDIFDKLVKIEQENETIYRDRNN